VTTEIRLLRDEDWEQVTSLMVEAFRSRFRPADVPLLRARYRDEMRVLVEDGCVVAGCRVKLVGHWYSGRSVPCGTVCSMFVAPQARGKGYGRAILEQALREMRAAGMALSTLHPSSLAFYRRLGYEIAGLDTRYRLAARHAPAHPRFSVEPWDAAALDGVVRCYERVARRSNGLIDRTPDWWNEYPLRAVTTQPYATGDQPMYRVLTRADDGEVDGYLIYAQRPHPVVRYAYDMVCTDLIWASATAARALLGFVAANRAIGGDLHWPGPVDEPLAAFVPESDVAVESTWPFTSRIVNLPLALERRGYGQGAEAEVALAVSDPLATEPESIRLQVAGGVARLTPFAAARATIDIGALTAIYTGWLTARDAVRVGRLTDATDADIHALETIFAGPKPWMSDAF
jgi:predicted acetyltransferase